MNHEELFTIARLILAEREGALPEHEARRLEAWREERPEHEALFQRLQDDAHLREGILAMEKADGERAMATMQRRVRARRGKILAAWMSAASVVAVLVGLFYFTRPGESRGDASPIVITPGGPRATLELADGSIVLLDTLRGGLKQGDVALAKSSPRQLAYLSRETPGDTPPAMNEIRVPRGGEFELVLSDGSRVWINAGSRLRFPVRFPGGERRVVLEGEAYFEVAGDSLAPFRVETGAHLVEARGTAFNVSAYGDVPVIYTTLVSGQVQVSDGMHDLLLEPGEQCVAYREPAATGMELRHVNAEEVAAWREGAFILEGQTLEEIARDIARWYDVEVIFRERAPKNVAFKGRIPRYADLQEVLLTLERTGEVSFSVVERTIIVDK
jgi:ferric-dicitrate binding protein FerR (iron transport regulator)